MIKSVYLRGDIVQRACKSSHRKAIRKYGVVDGGNSIVTFIHWFSPNLGQFICSRSRTDSLMIVPDRDILPSEVVDKAQEIMAKMPLKQPSPRTKFYRR